MRQEKKLKQLGEICTRAHKYTYAYRKKEKPNLISLKLTKSHGCVLSLRSYVIVFTLPIQQLEINKFQRIFFFFKFSLFFC